MFLSPNTRLYDLHEKAVQKFRFIITRLFNPCTVVFRFYRNDSRPVPLFERPFNIIQAYGILFTVDSYN